MNYAKTSALPLLFSIGLLSLCASVFAEEKQSVFSSDFEGESQKWSLVYGAEIDNGQAHSGTNSVKIENEASIRTKYTVTESGTMELWIRTSTPVTNYKIKVLVNSSLSNDAGWVQAGAIEG